MAARWRAGPAAGESSPRGELRWHLRRAAPSSWTARPWLWGGGIRAAGCRPCRRLPSPWGGRDRTRTAILGLAQPPSADHSSIKFTGGGSQLDDPDEDGRPRVAFAGLDIDIYDVARGLDLLRSE